VDADNFQLSADGTRAAGLFPWPDGGVADLEAGTWQRHGRGCWASMCPDNSYRFWIFDGAHRHVILHAPGGAAPALVSINTAPELRDAEVYHPRWTNSPRHFVVTGPYLTRKGANKIRGGGPEIEIFLGRFDAGWRTVERWVRLTHNRRADLFPDAWFEECITPPPATPAPAAPPPAALSPPAASASGGAPAPGFLA